MTSSRKRWLVYSSAGDRASIASWATGPRDFDVFLTYYGDDSGRYAELADAYEERQGVKFPNLMAWYRRAPEQFAGYDAVLVIDDDLALSADEISQLFRIREQRDLWLLQPAFSARGKVSWGVTRQRPWCELRFTNFVENGAPLFVADKLWKFLDVYDATLLGFGVDYWYLDSIGARENPGRVAVIDSIVTCNPTNRQKGGPREIDTTQTPDQRQAVFAAAQERVGIPDYPPETITRVLLPIPQRVRATLVAVPDLAYWAYVCTLGRGPRRRMRHRIYRWLRPLRQVAPSRQG